MASGWKFSVTIPSWTQTTLDADEVVVVSTRKAQPLPLAKFKRATFTQKHIEIFPSASQETPITPFSFSIHARLLDHQLWPYSYNPGTLIFPLNGVHCCFSLSAKSLFLICCAASEAGKPAGFFLTSRTSDHERYQLQD